MRKSLKSRNGERFRVRGRVDRFGAKSAYKGPDIPTVLVLDIVDVVTGETLTDHMWFRQGKRWHGVRVGDVIEFDARVDSYEAGYRGRRADVVVEYRIDYRLTFPTKLVVIPEEAS